MNKSKSKTNSTLDEFHAPLPNELTKSKLNHEQSHTFTSDFVKGTLLQKNQNPNLQFDTKVKDKILQLDDRVTNFATLKSKRIQQQKKNNRKLLYRKQRRELGLYDIPKESQKYHQLNVNVRWDLFVPLHQLWLGYMDNLLKDVTNLQNIFAKLVKADFHGAIVTVTRSKCPSNIGIYGIIVKDTENMLYLITKGDEMKVIPKQNNVFSIAIRDKLFTLYGNQFCHRPADRASKKFKTKQTVDL
ncbi:Rof/RNase P-like protein [Globomyces pollinis-pini]|nr:Rof/RNase P-like protein [Globomyces pollinis-pini]KAJ3000669.1 RNase P/RNase MRP complex subunit [Globomyces sp. JEL0801]